MKKILNILMIGLISAVAFASCDNPLYPSEGETNKGEGQASLATMALSVVNSEKVMESRAYSVVVGDFTVNIINKTTGAVANTWKYSEMPEIITLPVGNYTVETYNMENKDADWESPYFYDSKDFEIKEGEITSIGELKCTLQNVKVGIFFSDELKAAMGTDVVVNVSIGDNQNLDFAYNETRSGYFKYTEGITTLKATFSGTVDGFYVSQYQILTDVAPGQYRKITFSLKDTPSSPDEYGQIGLSGLSLDATITTIDLTRNVTIGGEEVIDPDDFITVSAAKVDFGCEASTKAVTVSSSSAWVATSDQTSWCKITNVSGSGFTISADANSATTARTAIVTVAMGNVSKTIQVNQAAYSDSKPAPSFTSENIDLSKYNDASLFGTDDGLKSAIVDISAPNGIAHVNVTIDSETLKGEVLTSVGLAAKFDLGTGLSDSGQDLTGGLASLGFPVANGGTAGGYTYGPVLNETSLKFDITQFVPLLSLYGAAKHNFIVEVVDNSNLKSSTTIMFETK